MSRPLDADQLRAIEIGLRGKLRARQVSESFIDRHIEDLIQQALTEYARACERGQRIVNPGGWVVHTASQRATDQMRRESHEVGHLSGEMAAGALGVVGLPADEEAIRHIEVEQLHRAIARLSVAQRQALSLYYFEEKSTRDGAKALGWSEPTFRRRRDSAMRALRERFGVTVPAFDIGLAAWLSLAGAQGNLGGVADPLLALADSVRAGISSAADRSRDLLTRLLSSGGGETVSAAASTPLGRTVGVCATAVAACAATGVI